MPEIGNKIERFTHCFTDRANFSAAGLPFGRFKHCMREIIGDILEKHRQPKNRGYLYTIIPNVEI